MEIISCTYRALLCISLWEFSGSQHEPHNETFPMEVVVSAENSARDRGVEPTSVLLLDLGSVLTRGSFTTEALLLSLRLNP